MPKQFKNILNARLERFITLTKQDTITWLDAEKRTVKLSFSSENPCRTRFGNEILLHGQDNINLSRLNDSGPLCLDHDFKNQIGCIENAYIDSESKKGYAVVRFSKSQKAEEIFQDVKDGIRKNISVGYTIEDIDMDKSDNETYYASRWTPLEVSFVALGADPMVGVTRSLVKEDNQEVINSDKATQIKDSIIKTQIEVKKMADEKDKKVETSVLEIKSDDKKRVREILAIAEKHPEMMSEAREAIEKDIALEDFQKIAMERIYKQEKTNEFKGAPIGLSGKEIKQYSFMKAIRALSYPNDKEAQKDAAFEFEVSRAYAEKSKTAPKGLFVPPDVCVRTFNQTTGAGSNLIATELRSDMFIDILRNKLATGLAGVTVLDGLVGNVAIPRQTSAMTGYWFDSEATVITAASNPTFDQVTLTPHTVGAYGDISRSMLKQSTPAAEMLVRNDIAAVLALMIDLAVLKGTNSGGQPKGITLTSGIGSGAWATDNTPSWAKLVAMETAVDVANALDGELNYIMGAALVGKCKTILKDAAVAGYLMEPNGMVNGYNTIRTNQLSTGEALFGKFSDAIVGMWGGLDLQVDPYLLATAGAIRITALQDVDVAVRRAASFVFYQNPSNS